MEEVEKKEGRGRSRGMRQEVKSGRGGYIYKTKNSVGAKAPV